MKQQDLFQVTIKFISIITSRLNHVNKSYFHVCEDRNSKKHNFLSLMNIILTCIVIHFIYHSLLLVVKLLVKYLCLNHLITSFFFYVKNTHAQNVDWHCTVWLDNDYVSFYIPNAEAMIIFSLILHLCIFILGQKNLP